MRMRKRKRKRKRKREKEKERDKNSPRVLLRIFNTQRSLRAGREIQHKPTRLFGLKMSKNISRLNYVEKSRKVNNDFGDEFKTFS